MRHFGRRRICALLVLAAGALAVATGAAAAPGVSTTTPFTYFGDNSCAVEAFTGTGTMHTVTSDNLSPSGNIQFNLTVMVDGLQAVTVTGKKYVVHDTFSNNFTISKATESSFTIVAHVMPHSG